jgi:hypothetical protein
VYGTDTLTPLAAVPLVNVPVIVVEPQFNAPRVAGMAEASLMQRTVKPPARKPSIMLASLALKARKRELEPLTVLLQ